MKRSMACLLGIGFGILVGLLVGLSQSPIASAALGMMSTLVVLLASKPGKELAVIISRRIQVSTESPEDVNGNHDLFLLTFVFAAICSLILGICLRTFDVLAPSLSSRIDAYVDAGYPLDVAKAAVLYRSEGLYDGDKWKAVGNAPYTPSSLYNDTNPTQILSIDPNKYQTFSDARRKWESSGSPFKEISTFVNSLTMSDEAKQIRLHEFWTLFTGDNP
jgi:hypothetical protein